MLSIKQSGLCLNLEEYYNVSEIYAVDWVQELKRPRGVKGCVSYTIAPEVTFKGSEQPAGYATISLEHNPQYVLFTGLVENAWGNNIKGKKQCDAIVCPSPASQESALLFIEFKNSTSSSPNTLNIHKKKAVKQFEETKELLLREKLPLEQRRLYALLWFPPSISSVSATLFSPTELRKLKEEKGIMLYVGQGIRYISDTSCKSL